MIHETGKFIISFVFQQLYKWKYNLISRSCPWRDQGPSQSWGLGDFQSLYGNLWKNGKKEYLWRVKLIDTLRGIYRYFYLFK